jgi:endonuclease YncB( thermonuclease family)
MKLPPLGLYLPVRLHRVVDGDTIEIKFRLSERIYPIRLLDCWAPELKDPGGQEAKQFVKDYLSKCRFDIVLYIPLPKDPFKILKMLTFGRILGHIFVSQNETLSEVIVSSGHATKTKQ